MKVPAGTKESLAIHSPCISNGDLIVFILVDQPKGTAPDLGSSTSRSLMRNARKPAEPCENARLVADDPNMGGEVVGGNITVKLTDAVYTMCLAKKEDYARTGGGGFWYYYGGKPPHYAVLQGGDGGNIRTQPWEPRVDGGAASFEEDDCTMSDIFCKHNRTAANTTSTVFAGQVETGKPAIDLAASADERGLAAQLANANLTLGGAALPELGARSSGYGGWKADGTWSASAG